MRALDVMTRVLTPRNLRHRSGLPTIDCVQLTRSLDHPIIDASTCDSIGVNIQGPSVIEAPVWLPNPLGRFLLYFADHKGGHIRLAYADAIEGPWTVHQPGALQLADSCFLTEPPPHTAEQIASLRDCYEQALGSSYDLDGAMVDATTPHIASPDVHVDHEHRQIVMYFHGLERLGVQLTRVALSSDGINFDARPQVLGSSYFRVFRYGGYHYALVMPGQILRSTDGLTGFEPGPTLFEPAMRHSAVLVDGKTLHVLWTRVGDAPESLIHSTIDLAGDWMAWSSVDHGVVMQPERRWEGAEQPVEPSKRGAVHGLANQLRDPCLFSHDRSTYVLYAGGGESAIGLAVAEI